MNVGDGVKSIRSIRDRNRRLHCVSCVCGLKDKKQTETAYCVSCVCGLKDKKQTETAYCVSCVCGLKDKKQTETAYCVSCVCGLKDKKQTETASFGLRRLCIDFSALDFWMVSVFVFDNDAV